MSPQEIPTVRNARVDDAVTLYFRARRQRSLMIGDAIACAAAALAAALGRAIAALVPRSAKRPACGDVI